MFDLDRDGFLNRNELKTLLETSVLSFRRVSKGPGEQVDKKWIEHHFKLMITEGSDRINFTTFKIWAERNLNVYHLLNTFELVPSPLKERKLII